MKKIKELSFMFIAVLCFAFFGGCAVYPSVTIDGWNFAPQQVSGTEIDLSLFSGSELKFDFTIKNQSEARTLRAENFDVIFKSGNNEQNAISVYFDNHEASIDFIQNESKNIKLCALATATVSESDKLIIEYDGRVVVEYKIK